MNYREVLAVGPAQCALYDPEHPDLVPVAGDSHAHINGNGGGHGAHVEKLHAALVARRKACGFDHEMFKVVNRANPDDVRFLFIGQRSGDTDGPSNNQYRHAGFESNLLALWSGKWQIVG